MSSLAMVKTSEADFGRCWQGLRAELSLAGMLLDEKDKVAAVRGIIDGVRKGRDKSLLAYTGKFDGVKYRCAKDFCVSTEALAAGREQMDGELAAALGRAIENVRSYQSRIKVTPPDDWEEAGVRLGVRYRPLERVGVCIPGASAPLLSTVIMTVVPAQVAGVGEIVVISPPSCEGGISPDILGLCAELGVTEVYSVFGAQAVAALALGTETIGKVDKIVGPSNEWAQLAKKELFGLVDIDSFAGPSDVLIVADASAKAAHIAADLLSQAEHAPGSAVLLTDSTELAEDAVREVDKQLAQLGRAEATRKCVEKTCLAVVTKDLDEAIALANEFGPEHLQVQCDDSEGVAERITNAGAVFVGFTTPVAVGDYYAGPSHVLPVGGTARMFGPLNVNDFIKQSSVISYDGKALEAAAEDIGRIADAEGLDGHKRSVQIRVEE